ncbi:LysM peptidoglycan-binding domain-containing protein [Cytobacillus solani]|uniref:LysM peptidoglycan-binding domain-containing protein n=1 Tax=Cytobacillus solani TaxID=1637975 RepID=UPI00207A5770|nr:LysM peptidoglycan-binding domain-containing protein [Cytobacillus solani]USK53918.1 LysM peptidoglycan-binding domain-containing protein [Cytobacillus solani]
MNRPLQKNNILLIILSIFLLTAFFVGIYFFLLYPKMEKIKLKEMELQSQEQLLATLKNKGENTEKHPVESTIHLQEQVPVKPMAQQLLLDIEKAEVVSGSFVANMTFQDGGVIELDDNKNVDAENSEEAETDGTAEEESSTPLPEGVEKITVNLTIESPSYFDFESFLQILENLNRIVVVEAIDFTANEEIIEESQENTPITYQVTLSAFYMPTLSDLIDQLPKIETPKPANKKNPFSSFGEYTNEKVQNNQSKSINSSNNSNVEIENGEVEITDSNGENDIVNDRENTTNHVVKPGDTIYKLAIKYYNSNNGIEIIREANHLKDNKIITGQVLIIPLAKNE